MDVQVGPGGYEVALRGSRTEFGYLSECSKFLGQVAAEDVLRGQPSRGFEDDKLRVEFAGVPSSAVAYEVTIAKGRAFNLLLGIELMVGRLDQNLTALGPDARTVTDPITKRRARFAGLLRDLQPTLEPLKEK